MAAVPPSAPLTDWPTLEARYAFKPEFLLKLLNVALQSQADIASQMRDAAKAEDFERMRFLAHGTKGMAGNLMAASLMEIAHAAELAAKAQQPGLSPQFEELADLVDRWLAELREHTGPAGS